MPTRVMPPHAGICALILAAGKGERMGKVKALLPVASSPNAPSCSALARLARLYHACGIERVLVVSGFHAEEVEEEARGLGLPVARNQNPEEGMFSSVRTGLAWLAAEGTIQAAFIQPVDIPLVRLMTLMAMLACFKTIATPQTPPPVLVPSFREQEGHPPLIPAHLFTSLLTYEGQGGLRAALAKYPKKTVPVADALILEDMDTPKDYIRITQLASWQECLFPAEALALLDIRQIPERGLRHAQAVGRVAFAFAKALVQKRMAKGQKANCHPWLALSGGLLHDIAKGEPNHEAAGGALFNALGLSKMAELISSHRDLSLPKHAPITERELIYLADKYCLGETCVPLEKRFAEKMHLFSKDASALRAITERLERARDMESRLAKEIAIAPENVAQNAWRGLTADWQKILHSCFVSPLRVLGDDVDGNRDTDN